jgi:hypothetical protein
MEDHKIAQLSHTAANVIKGRYRQYKVEQCNKAVTPYPALSQHHNRYSRNTTTVTLTTP